MVENSCAAWFNRMTSKPDSIGFKNLLVATPWLLPFDGRIQHSDGKTRRIAYSGCGHVSRTQRHSDHTLPHTHHTIEHEGQNCEP